MRISRATKKKNKRLYVRRILLIFLIIIPAAALITSAAIHLAISKEKNLETITAAFTPKINDVEAFKYNFDIEAKELYRVELARFDKYEEAEAKVEALKNKKLNGFIIKEQGFVAGYGLFPNKSQADTALEYLNRKNIKGTISTINLSGLNLKYDDMDKKLIELTSAVDTVVLDIISQKSALSLESLYSGKKISGAVLEPIAEQETRLVKYLNYLKDIKTSEENSKIKKDLEVLINEILVDRLHSEDSYDYYNLQNSLMNQGEALKKFYEKMIV